MLRQEIVIAIYCIIDDLLKENGFFSDVRSKVSDSQVLTTGLLAALCFGGVFNHANLFLRSFGVFTASLSKGRLSRRMHRLEPVLEELVQAFGKWVIDARADKSFIVDSTPLAVCDNIRISRCRIVEGSEFRGFQASFHRYFYGLKLQLMVNGEGIPVQYTITEGSMHDALGVTLMKMELSPESEVFADAAYASKEIEKSMSRKYITWLADRKKNSRTPHPKETAKRIKKMRKRIETVFSSMKALFKRHINVITLEGFLLKIKYFILAFQLKKLLNY